MNYFGIIDAPSILGLRPSGVEYLPLALKAAGLIRELDADYIGAVPPPAYSATRDAVTQVLNPQAIHDYSLSLADALQAVVARGQFPLVLGGDCSILLGNMLALRAPAGPAGARGSFVQVAALLHSLITSRHELLPLPVLAEGL